MISFANLWGRITGGDAGKTFPQQQGKSLDRVSDNFAAQPYGFYANLPNGQLFKVIDSEGRVIMGVTVDRPSGIEQGEVTVHHPATGALIHLRNDEKIRIHSPVEVIVDTPLTTLTGDLVVEGETDLSDTVRSNGKDISDTHTHNGSPTAPDGAVSNTGAPN